MERQATDTPQVEPDAWWLEITTDEPYVYLFGPFDTLEEARGHAGDYTGDLLAEGWWITHTGFTQSGPNGL